MKTQVEVKTQAVVEVKKNDRIYSLVLPGDAPLGEILDVIYDLRGLVVEKINESQKVDAPRAVEEEKKTEEPQA